MKLRYYPFLVDLEEFSTRHLGFRVSLKTLASDPSVVEPALSYIESAASGEAVRIEPLTSEEAVFTFYLTLALAKALGPSALEALARSYSSRAAAALEFEDEASLLSLSASAGLRVQRGPSSIPWTVGRDGKVRFKIVQYALPLPDYLRTAADSGAPELALANQLILNGLVYVDRRKLARLLEIRFYRIILQRASSLDVEELFDTGILERAREAYERGLRRRRGISWDPNALPPCIKESLSSIARGTADAAKLYLSATFIGAIGLTAGELAPVLGLSETDPRVRGLVKLSRIASDKGYTVYTCEEASRRGLCTSRDSCRASDPFREYLRRLRLKSRGTGRSASY